MCLTPIELVRDGRKDTFPCGRCPKCVSKRISGWTFRLMQEDKYALSSWFVTLSYSPDHVPITIRGRNTVDKRDCQLFFKKLRKANNGRKIKYYLVAEYGGRRQRPHYHIILFNACIETISTAWGKGDIFYGRVSGASIGYCFKYLQKPGRVPLYKADDRKSEFSLKSTGIGKSYLTYAMMKWHMQDVENRMYCNIEDGKKIAMPRYYKEKIYNNAELKGRLRLFHTTRIQSEKNKINSNPKFDSYFHSKEAATISEFKKMYYSSKQKLKIQ